MHVWTYCRVTYDLWSTCTDLTSPLAAQTWSSYLQVGVFKNGLNFNATSYVPVVIRNVWYQQPGMSLTNRTVVFAAATTAPTTSATVSAPVFSVNGATGRCTCENVVTEAYYTLEYSPTTNAIARAFVDLVLTSVTVGAVSGANLCAGKAAIVPQIFVLNWNATTNAGTKMPTAKSGAPGYSVGLPVLAGIAVTDPAGVCFSSLRCFVFFLSKGTSNGRLVFICFVLFTLRCLFVCLLACLLVCCLFVSWTTFILIVTGTGKTAINPMVAGLTVPGATQAGQCTVDTAQRNPVAFGYDLQASCLLPLTLAQLQARCQSTSVGGSLLCHFSISLSLVK